MCVCGGRVQGGAGYVQATGPDEYACACAEGFVSIDCEVLIYIRYIVY